jgi:hypothetical protein
VELQLVLERAGAFFDAARTSADAARRERPAYPSDGARPWLTFGYMFMSVDGWGSAAEARPGLGLRMGE